MKKKITALILLLTLACGSMLTVPTINVYAEDTGEKLIAITFDDGPGSYTSELIDELDSRGVKATFFMLGTQIDQYPDIVKKMHNSGHELGNHSWDHANFWQLSVEEIEAQIMDTNKLLEKIDGNKYHVLRCPYGNSNSDVEAIVNAPIFHWSIDTLDWESHNADTICDVITSNVYDGAISLAHDIYDSSVQGVLKAVDKLKADGYTFVTASTLLAKRGIESTNGETYYDARNKGITLPDTTPEPIEDPIGTAYVKNTAAIKSKLDKDSSLSGIISADSLVSILNADDETNIKVQSLWGGVGYINANNLVKADGEPSKPMETKKAEPISIPNDALDQTAVTVGCVDIYSSPEGGVSVGRLPLNSPITVLQYTSDSVTMIQTASGTTAYVKNEKIKNIQIGSGRKKDSKDAKTKGINLKISDEGSARIDMNLRSAPTNKAIIESVVTKNTKLTILECLKNNWCSIKTEDGREGFVRTFAVATGKSDTFTLATVTDNVNFRPKPNTDDDPFRLINAGERVHILNSSTKDWVLVLTSNLSVGYLSAEFVKEYSKK